MMYYAQWEYMFYYTSICTQVYVPCARLLLHGSIFCGTACAETFCIARTLSHDQWRHEQTSFCSWIPPVQRNGQILLLNHRPLVMLWRIVLITSCTNQVDCQYWNSSLPTRQSWKFRNRAQCSKTPSFGVNFGRYFPRSSSCLIWETFPRNQRYIKRQRTSGLTRQHVNKCTPFCHLRYEDQLRNAGGQ